jgi:hypothetical protein
MKKLYQEKTNILTFFSEPAETGEDPFTSGKRSAVSFGTFLAVGGLYSKLRNSLGNLPGVFPDDDVVSINDDEVSNVDVLRVTLFDTGVVADIVTHNFCSISKLLFLFF